MRLPMKRVLAVLLLLGLTACRETFRKAETIARPGSEPKMFRTVDVPMLLDTPEQRAEYVAKNYWNHFDFSDTSYVDLPEVTEQAFADYVNLLGQMHGELASQSVRITLSKAEADSAMYGYFVELFEKYLYDPNSPMRNEALYIPALEAMIASERLGEADKVRARYRLELARRNRPGTPATDFRYRLASGAWGTLYGVKADYTILFLNNPGCTACKETIGQIVASEPVGRMIARGKVKVLAVYPDEDMKTWRDYLPHFPSAWINAYDADLKIKSAELYDLKAIPTLYLLDGRKTVLLRDAPFPRIERYLIDAEAGRS